MILTPQTLASFSYKAIVAEHIHQVASSGDCHTDRYRKSNVLFLYHVKKGLLDPNASGLRCCFLGGAQSAGDCQKDRADD
jgi:hypothetical protein